MRINIKTKARIKDKEIKALYVISAGMKLVSPRMIKPTLEFIVGRYGYKIQSHA